VAGQLSGWSEGALEPLDSTVFLPSSFFYQPDSGGSASGPFDIFGCQRHFNYTGQGRVLNRADRQMARDVPAIPLFQIPLPAAHRTAVRGFVHSTVNPLWNAEDWWLAR
jgi:hypothetical protein